ncbi:hypothetical protein KO516_05590 [Citreicella sp. C3M06]|uniref:hypothetical protein n=1 Tax=Citreicella sp. C3M06 TaxID=2841564 RepID=UPI001C087EA7|nr:hypothetical protein [Citreicella sp. C3M06]MBU2960300.1 hypothetical protein [Citreicella sp. C3M06]
MIERSHPTLLGGAQCRLLSISRPSLYRAPQRETAVNLALMQLLDQQFLETPFYGIQQMAPEEPRPPGERERIRRLIPIYRKPNTSKHATGYCPCLLGGLRVDRPNQVLLLGSCCA